MRSEEIKLKKSARPLDTVIRCFATLLLVPALGACSEREESMKGLQTREPPPAEGTKVQLELTGYNYTNRSIGQFSVNSNGGGNVHVSSPTSGGGGSVCCVTYIVGIKKWRVLVRWQTGACTYNNEVDGNGERSFEVYRYFKESEIDVDPVIPSRPNILEVHFYPDGHLEAAITEESSAPRLRLPKERESKLPYRRCPNDARPEE
jgi:hypothetical protein